MNVTHQDWTLHYTIGDAIAAPVKVGDIIDNSRGEQLRVLSGTSPHKVNSTGRVYVESVAEGWKMNYFPSVIGGRWVHKGGGLGG
jgi:hypothetical protein